MTAVRLRAGLLLAAAVAATSLAGCAASGTSGAGASATLVATDHVDLPRSYKFAPTVITVAAGTTVTWTNDDNFTHSVELDGVAAPGLVMHPGESVSQQFATAGTFHYVCTFHPRDMQGTVVVTAG
ncbi:MAG TPA: plastocyanin/azurin family copper-binding protein [Candidatus Limnocylindrales bacterium]|nr:plastocyanin/azurin family copper-binding protein [Candidatus Limnocylindrales bacterium]